MLNERNIPLEEDGIEEEILVDEEVTITKAMWGDIGGNIENQTDLQNALDAKQDSLTEAQLNAVNSGITAEKVTTYDGYADQIASKANQSALNAEATTREQADTALGTRIDNEALARQSADNGLQSQIDAITSKSDVVDVVANYAALQAYDTSTLGNNDVVKVLDDETHEDALTYYRWSTTTQTWSYIGQEAPYYSKGQMDVKLAEKQDKLTAGANIQIQNGTISATDTTYTAGNGLNLNGTEFSADTDVLATKEDIAAYKTVSTPVIIEDGYYLKSLNEVSGSTGVQQFDAHGKNLLDISKLSVGYLSSIGNPQNSHPLGEMYSGFIKVKPNTTYTFSIQKTDSNNDDWMAICEYKKPFMSITYPMFITRSVVYLSREITITTGSTTNYVALSARNLEQATEVQFEEGSKTTYEPYVGGIAQLDLYTNNILDAVTPSRLDGFIRNTGEIVGASDFYTCYIPCEPDTTYVVTKKCHIADRSAWSNMLKIGSSSIVPAAGGSVSSLVAEADGTRATYAINTTTSDAQYLVIFFARNRDYSEALAELSIYRASDAIDLSGSNKIIRDGSSWFVHDGAAKTAITNSTLIRQLNELNDSGISLDGEIEAEVISPENGTPAIISLGYWTIYKGEKGEKGDTPDVTEIETDIAELQRFVDYDKTVIGVNHRGYNQVAPENTLSAFRLSKKMGFNYVETDVSFTSDSVAVCLHDDTIDRTSNGTGNINDLTYDQVSQYDFGSWKSPAYAGEKIPTFEQFIKLCRNLGLKPYIELKNSATYTEAQIQSIVDIVERNGMQGKVTYISFNATYLSYIKDYDGEARLGYLADITSATITTATGLRTSSNEVFIDTSYGNATSAKVQLAMATHLPVEVWTVDLENTIIGLDSYVTGVTSDNLIAGKVLYEANIED